MEEQWHADRCQLRDLLRVHPDWSARQVAEATGGSLGWAKTWRRRLRVAGLDDEAVVWGQSRARTHAPPAISAAVIDHILAIRDDPPGLLQRVPGPKAILYYLHRDPALRTGGERLPRSTRTIWQILTRHGRIAQRFRRDHAPLDRPALLSSWQLDFKDIASVPAEPDGKRQHRVEALNCVDCGTSLVVATRVRDDFTEE